MGSQHRSTDKVKVIIYNKGRIQFEEQKQFLGMTYNKKLRCDFYLNDYNVVIEYNGKQHY